LNINNKNALLAARQTMIDIGGYNSMREGDKGENLFIIFYSPILELVGKSGYVSFLGKAHGALLHVIIKTMFLVIWGFSC
jgi:hypothetical protein